MSAYQMSERRRRVSEKQDDNEKAFGKLAASEGFMVGSENF